MSREALAIGSDTSEVHLNSLSEFQAQLENLTLGIQEADSHLKEEKKLVQILEGKLKNERDLFLKLLVEKAETDNEFIYLQKCLTKRKEENEELESKISDLIAKLRSLDVENSEKIIKNIT